MSLKRLPPGRWSSMTGAGITKTRLILIVTGLYITMHSEADMKELVAQWRAKTGVDDPVKETFVERVIRRWKKEPVKLRGWMECTVDLDLDQRIFTAYFHQKTS